MRCKSAQRKDQNHQVLLPNISLKQGLSSHTRHIDLWPSRSIQIGTSILINGTTIYAKDSKRKVNKEKRNNQMVMKEQEEEGRDEGRRKRKEEEDEVEEEDKGERE